MAKVPLVNDPNTSTIKVLHVDDDPSFLQISMLMLKETDSSFSVESVVSVDEANRKLATETYDLILSDYEMPNKSGLDFLKELKQKNTAVPFILFTGRGREEIAIQALNLGADGYYNKQGSPETVYGELAHGIKSAVTSYRARQALKDSEFKFENIANFATEWIYWLTPDHHFNYVSPSCLKITGYSAEDFLSDPELLTRIIDPRDQKHTYKHFDDFTDLENHTAEFRIKTKDNQTRWIQHQCTPIVDDEGRWLGRRATNQDITEHKLACEQVARSEEKYRDLVDNLSEGVWIIDPSACTIFVNPTMAKMLGYTPEEMVGEHLFVFVEEKQMATIKSIMSSRNRGNSEILNYDFEFQHKDGTTRILSANTRAILDKKGKLIELLGTFIDVTERKKAETALLESEERLKFATESANIGLWDLDLVDHTAYRSAVHNRIFGYDNVTDEWTFEKFLSHMLPEYRIKFQELTKKAIGERHGWSFECEIRRVDGEVRRIWFTGRLYIAASGHDRVAGIILDVTDRKKQ